jgi:hypothetical protein
MTVILDDRNWDVGVGIKMKKVVLNKMIFFFCGTGV